MVPQTLEMDTHRPRRRAANASWLSCDTVPTRALSGQATVYEPR